MKKTTALEILRRYDNYAIVTIHNQDVCDSADAAFSNPFFDSYQLIYLWSNEQSKLPFEGDLSTVHPVRDYFTLSSFTDALEEKDIVSPWSRDGYLGGSFSGHICLLPPDLTRVIYELTNSAIKAFPRWSKEDEACDAAALDCGRLYADMGDWSPTSISCDAEALKLGWDCAASAEHMRKCDDAKDWYWTQWRRYKEPDDQIEMAHEMGVLLGTESKSEIQNIRHD